MAQIKSLISNRDFYEAMDIADTIDWRRVRSISMLCTVSEIYKVNRRYEDARGILQMAYGRYPEGRTIVYALCELSIKLGELPEAVKYLKEYMRLAPGDPGIYILQYKLYQSQGVGLEECIQVLVKLKEAEYQERWAYELALLYHKNGQIRECVDECDELIVWFGRGKYVTKAMELKMQHTDLTEDQKRKYALRNEPDKTPSELLEEDDDLEEEEAAEEEQEEQAEEEEVEEEPVREEYNSQIEAEETVSEDRYDVDESDAGPVEEEMVKTASTGPISIQIKQIDPSNQPTKRIPQKEINQAINAEDIEIKPVNMSKYSTMNLQAEIKKNLAEFAKRTGQPLREKEEKIVPSVPYEKPSEEIYPEDTEETAGYDYTEEAAEEEEDITTELPTDEVEESLQETEEESFEDAESESEEDEEPVEEQDEAEEEDEADEESEEETENTSDEVPYEEEYETSYRRHYEVEDDEEAEEEPEEEESEEEPEEEDDEEEITEDDPPQEIEHPVIRTGARKKYAVPKPREVEGFSDEEKEIFADFLQMHKLPEIIREALNEITMEGKIGNVIITGNEEKARINLAAALSADLRLNNPDFLGKIARIKADLFNTKDIEKALKALDGGALVIERAGDLSDESLDKIHNQLLKQDTSIVVFMEDARLAMKRTEADHMWIDDIFNVKINIPTYTNDDLVFHAKEYAKENECTIDAMGILALYTRIDELQTAEHYVTINEVEKIVDEAIKHSEKRSIKHVFEMIVGKRYDQDDMIILKERDFI
ncbi:MAG: tetratricopeptide repeat protein [Lachnospiraceae bacterium]|nr:tetratricopeptide repeat protein [Lachnospiraceae bacterium]